MVYVSPGEWKEEEETKSDEDSASDGRIASKRTLGEQSFEPDPLEIYLLVR